MQNISGIETASQIASFDGVEVYYINAPKFKTNSINIFFIDEMDTKNASLNALIPAVLRRGCKGFPEYRDIAKYLEELYGASFDCGVAKKGEYQILHFYMEYARQAFVGGNEFLDEKCFELLLNIITSPILENGTFKQDYLDQEKENLKQLIESRMNDKVQFAVDRCFEEMCKDEPYGVYEYGTVEDVKAITSENLYRQYSSLLKALPVKVFLTGDFSDEIAQKIANKLGNMQRDTIKILNILQNFKVTYQTKETTEPMNVNQSKLCLGFRTNISPSDNEYYALLVFNGILGGGMHSKLFQNVREKAGLAYYVFSRLEKFKGLMIISSGIEAQNKEITREIMMQQLEDMKKGQISSYEYDSTIKTIENGITSLKDSQMQMVDFFLGQVLTNTSDTLDSIIQKVREVRVSEVMKVSEKIMLNEIYFLTSKE